MSILIVRNRQCFVQEVSLVIKEKSQQPPINFYATLAYVREFDGKQNYRLNGHQECIGLGGNWFEYSVGADIEFNEQNMLFFDIRGKHGNKFDHSTLNLGYKYRFE